MLARLLIVTALTFIAAAAHAGPFGGIICQEEIPTHVGSWVRAFSVLPDTLAQYAVTDTPKQRLVHGEPKTRSWSGFDVEVYVKMESWALRGKRDEGQLRRRLKIDQVVRDGQDVVDIDLTHLDWTGSFPESVDYSTHETFRASSCRWL